MNIKQEVPDGISSLDPGHGIRETVPSHILTAHEGVGGVLSATINDKDAFTLLTPSLDRQKGVSLTWTGVNSELEEAEKEELSRKTNEFAEDELGLSRVEEVPTTPSDDYREVQEVMHNAWADTGIGDAELIPTYEFKAKDQGGNLIVEDLGGVRTLAYMFPDLEQEGAVYSHAVGAEEQRSGIGAEIKRMQRQKVLEAGFNKIYWTVDPLKPVNNRLNTTKLGGKATEYKEDVYNTETSGGTPADRFVVEWEVESDRVQQKLDSMESNEDSYLRNICADDVEVVLKAGDSTPNYEESLIERTGSEYNLDLPSDGIVGVEIPEIAVEDMDEDVEDEWRYASRTALQSLMDNGYEVTELMRPGENGFEQNTYILER